MCHSAYIDPAVLAGGSQLLELQLYYSRRKWSAARSTALLAALATQQQLTRLAIDDERWWGTSSAAPYSALTASSSLQQLRLNNCQVPAGAWQQMFQPTRRLPHLKSLTVDHDAGGYYADPEVVSHEALQDMVACCPALDTLGVDSHIEIRAAAPL